MQVANSPAPKIVSATLSAGLGEVSVKFDVPTDAAGAPSSSSCTAIFDASLVAKLGTAAECRWVPTFDPVTGDVLGYPELIVNFGPGPTLLPRMTGIPNYDTIAVAKGVLKDFPQASIPSTGSADVEMPTNVTTDPSQASSKTYVGATAVLAAPSRVAACDPVTLDASGSSVSGSRSLTFSWSLIEATTKAGAACLASTASCPRAVALKKHLAALGGVADASSLTLADDEIDVDSTVTSQVTVKNFLQRVTGATATATLTKASSVGVPSIRVLGAGQVAVTALNGSGVAASLPTGGFSIARGYDLILRGSAGLPSAAAYDKALKKCVPIHESSSTAALLFQWYGEVVNAKLALPDASKRPLVLLPEVMALSAAGSTQAATLLASATTPSLIIPAGAPPAASCLSPILAFLLPGHRAHLNFTPPSSPQFFSSFPLCAPPPTPVPPSQARCVRAWTTFSPWWRATPPTRLPPAATRPP